MICQSAKQSNEKFDASQLHDGEKRKHKTEILPDDGTGDVEVNTIPLFTHLSLKTTNLSNTTSEQKLEHKKGRLSDWMLN